MAKDQEKVKFAFEIYDFDGKGEVDMFYIGDLLRACDLNPSEKLVGTFSPPDRKGVKTMKLNDFLPMYNTVKKDKNKGSYEDFIEVMKLYDKQEDGTMMLAELEYILSALGEPMEKEDVRTALGELAPEEDEDGLIPYDVFVKKLCGKA
ncbi:unnamed protein product [Meganyctiphanes norvegica]|uniref:EF-hand domain-containing protein n=1 Tax=Meganyctiphanes norvegica TaxID=48144 RepID=A0AAV2PRK3_MEGNR